MFFFYSAVKLLPTLQKAERRVGGGFVQKTVKRKNKMYEIKDSVKTDALREKKEGEEGGDIERN